jgi:hypothetical protein
VATALLSRSTEMGARCLTHGMFIATDEDVHGKYLNNCRAEEESDFVISEDGARVQERVWVSGFFQQLKADTHSRTWS